MSQVQTRVHSSLWPLPCTTNKLRLSKDRGNQFVSVRQPALPVAPLSSTARSGRSTGPLYPSTRSPSPAAPLLARFATPPADQQTVKPVLLVALPPLTQVSIRNAETLGGLKPRDLPCDRPQHHFLYASSLLPRRPSGIGPYFAMVAYPRRLAGISCANSTAHIMAQGCRASIRTLNGPLWARCKLGSDVKPRSVTMVTDLGCWVLPSNERSSWTST